MACQKSLDFTAPPSADAHLSLYWTMDEAGDLDKVDSAAGDVWNATTGNLSPAAKFSNGTQQDCVFVGGAPFFHGLQNFDDLSLAFNSVTSTGVSVSFWFNKTVDGTALPLTFWQFFIDCHDPAYTVFSNLTLNGTFNPTAIIDNFRVRHNDSNGNDTLFDTTFTPVVGAWHMITATIDFTAHTLNLYIDAVLVKTIADLALPLTTPQGDIQLNCSFGVAGNPLVVLVDELLLSLKGALSQSQITTLFNASAGMTWPTVTGVVPYP